MTEFFKKLGQGLLYTLVLPVLIVVLAGYSVYGIIIFLIMLVKSIVLFFKGKSLNTDLPEDVEAKRRLKMLTNPFDNPAPAPEPKEEKDPVIIIERPREESVMDIPPQRQEMENREVNTYLTTEPINENRFPEIGDDSIDDEIFNEPQEEEKEEEPEMVDEPFPSIYDDEEERHLNIGSDDDEILPADEDDDLFEDDDYEDTKGGVSFRDWSDK